MTHGSLFSGIGGFDLAAEWMGWENVFHCEWNDFGKRILNYYWSQAISYHDITKTDFSVHRGQIDILTGGFPCQPYSAAGKRLGTEDDRHLWPDMLRTIREIQPRWVVGENVRGLVNWNDGLVFDEVQSDLEAEGFEVTPFILPACAINAPHRRDRVWFVGYRNATDTNCRGLEGTTEVGRNCIDVEREGIVGIAPDPNGKVSQRRDEGRETQRSAIPKERAKSFDSANAPDTDNIGLQGRKNDGSARESGQERNQQSSRRFQSAWQEFPTKSPLCGGDDGISGALDGITFPRWRKESIMAYGNAIVPQVAFQIFQAIAGYETRRT